MRWCLHGGVREGVRAGVRPPLARSSGVAGSGCWLAARPSAGPRRSLATTRRRCQKKKAPPAAKTDARTGARTPAAFSSPYPSPGWPFARLPSFPPTTQPLPFTISALPPSSCPLLSAQLIPTPQPPHQRGLSVRAASTNFLDTPTLTRLRVPSALCPPFAEVSATPVDTPA